ALNPLFAQAGDEVPDIPTIDIYVKANLRGDVDIMASAVGIKGDLAAIVRQTRLCDWREKTAQPHYVSGTCRRMLKSDGFQVDDQIRLAPLVSAFHKAGASEVHIEVMRFGSRE